MNPSTTLTVLSQLPDLGRVFSQDGKIANRVNGIDSANANPNMPTVGAMKLPCVAASTSSHPIIGPVHENDTRASVNAMKKRLSQPLELSTLLSILFVHEAGNTISKAPINEKAKVIRRAKKIKLNTGLVARLFKALAPNIAVIISPSVT